MHVHARMFMNACIGLTSNSVYSYIWSFGQFLKGGWGGPKIFNSKGNSYFWVYTQISDQLGQISDQLGQKSDHGSKTFFGFYQLFCYPKFKHVLWIPNVKKKI